MRSSAQVAGLLARLAHRTPKTCAILGLSQSDLAKAAKVHFSNIGRYERGEAMPAADILSRIAQELEVL
ncbi:MAG: helix-turn-helix transcriptional regulator [Flavobacteriales bacterium]|nr:helix-turn-helix transcriptional regulator [Flavobacteriales bacterium]